MIDIVVTWPKSQPLGSYLVELALAKRDGLLINYRVRYPPRPVPERCYIVHGGWVRGWSPVLDVVRRGEDEVAHVDGSGYWPAGWYVVRKPDWNVCTRQIEMPGFRGWRLFDRTTVGE